MKSLIHLDYILLRFCQEMKFPYFLSEYMRIVSRLGDYGALWFLLAAIFIMLPQYHLLGWYMMVGIISVIIFSEGILKFIIRRPRPFITYDDIVPAIVPPRSFSFPSGHTAMSWCATILICRSELSGSYVYISLMCIILAVSISLSRVYLRVHYLSDVVAGSIFGILIGMITSQIPLTSFLPLSF